MGWLVVLAVVTLLSQLASDAAFDLQVSNARIVATICLCTLLGVLYAGVAVAVAASPGAGPVLAIGLGAALVGYLVAGLFPLSDVLDSWAWSSPWDWALAGEPLWEPTDAWRYLALGGVSAAMLAVGLVAFARRDVARPERTAWGPVASTLRPDSSSPGRGLGHRELDDRPDLVGRRLGRAQVDLAGRTGERHALGADPLGQRRVGDPDRVVRPDVQERGERSRRQHLDLQPDGAPAAPPTGAQISMSNGSSPDGMPW